MNRGASSDRELLLPSWAAADGLGQITLLSLPFMLGMFVDSFGMGPQRAGLLVSVELATISIVCMAVSAFVGRLPRRTLAICGAAIALVGNTLSLHGSDFASFALSRAIAGIGYGLATAAGNAVIASAADPSRLYDNKMVLFALTQLLVDVAVPSAINHFGSPGFFGLMIATNLVMIPFILRLPQRSVSNASVSAQSKGAVGSDGFRGFRGVLPILIVLSLAVIFAIRESAYWGFLERFGAAGCADPPPLGSVRSVRPQ
jgi:MFS family permease